MRALASTLARRGARGVAPRAAQRLLSSSAGAVRVEFDKPFLTYNIDSPPDHTMVTRDELLAYYELMFKMRRMEIAADTLYKGKFVKGFCHLYDGQEAICVGMEAGCKQTDSLVTSYRDHCQQLARGDTVEGVLTELLGKAGGCAKGKGGSMHMYKADAHFYGGNGIVGGQCPLGAGLAFSHKYRDDGGVAFSLYGDGAANQGQLFEALNMAALWKLPLIYVCENNQYGMGTSKKRGSANDDYYTRGHYVPGIKVDGMNVLAVREATRFVREYAVANGPIVVEMDTYRYHGHSMSDPGITYRNRDEVAGVRAARDPVERTKRYLLDTELATQVEIKEIDARVKKEVGEAVETAKAKPFPVAEEAYTDIYTDQSPSFYIRGSDFTLGHGVYGTTK
jgi:pyruvate dehydrogenase E1 component alpha subunit